MILLACPGLIGNLAAQANVQADTSHLLRKSVAAIGYQVGVETKVDLKPTDLISQAQGEAKVQAKNGVTNIEVDAEELVPPTSLGTEFLTYVLWSVSPEGRTANLGEIMIDKAGKGKLKATTQLQTFSLIVTAEPYFSVRQPSEMVVLENEMRKDTKGKRFYVNEYSLMRRSQYQKLGNPLALSLDLKTVPLEVYEARNALDIAKSREAETYAPEIFTKASASLTMAENALVRKADKKEIISVARQAVQFSEDARALSTLRQEQERIEKEREAAAAQAKAEAEAKAAAEAAEVKRRADAEAAEAKRKADAEAAELKRKAAAEAEELRRRAAEEAHRQTQLAAAREAQLKAESQLAAAMAKVEADALKAREEEANAEAERARQAAEQARQAADELRAQLLEQFSRILETRDTPRGLVVNLSDVLFDTGKYELRPVTREKLARFSGIVLSHPSLSLDIEGHTDNTGTDEFNEALSRQRAEAVREFLIQQGLPPDSLTARGL
jgi:outer membrane protein OmpA-like peptidoglycan-associated protein